MAARARFSIALLMAVVFFVAADFAIVRAFWDSRGPQAAIAVITLPMINLLLLFLPKLKRGGDARPFWLGFEVVGWSIVLLFVLVGWFFEEVFFAPAVYSISLLDPFPENVALNVAFEISFAVPFYTIPQVLAASVGGWLSARCQIAHRRPSATVEEV
jgi:hypothetical protein